MIILVAMEQTCLVNRDLLSDIVQEGIDDSNIGVRLCQKVTVVVYKEIWRCRLVEIPEWRGRIAGVIHLCHLKMNNTIDVSSLVDVLCIIFLDVFRMG